MGKDGKTSWEHPPNFLTRILLWKPSSLWGTVARQILGHARIVWCQGFRVNELNWYLRNPATPVAPPQWHPLRGPHTKWNPKHFFWYPLGYCFPLRHPAARVFLATEPCRRTLLLALHAGVCLSLRLPTCGCCGSGSKIGSQWTYTMSRINQTVHFFPEIWSRHQPTTICFFPATVIGHA